MAELTAGAAEVVVTPPVGVELEGYGARKHPSNGVHDDLYAHALLLDDGATRVGLLTCDLIFVDRWMAEEVRRQVEAAGVIAGPNLMISATHTHSGPRGIVRLGQSVDEALIAVTARKLAGAVIAASQDMRPARLKLGRATVDSVCQNRRFPDSPIDPTLSVLRVEEAGTGKLLAALVNYTMHATVMNYDNLLISADYPGQVRRVIRRVLGEVPVLFANGCCGNVNPARVAAVFSEVERIGTVIGAEAVRLLTELAAVGQLVAADNLLWSERTPKAPPAAALDLRDLGLRAASTSVELPFRSFRTADDYQSAIAGLKAEIESIGIGEAAVEAIRAGRASDSGVAPDALASRRRLMGQLNRLQIEAAGAPRRERVTTLVGRETFRTAVQVIRLSRDVAIVGLPGEIVAEVGLALKAASGLPACLVFGYTGDSIGYVVVPAHFDEGGYEAGTTLFDGSAEAILRDAALGLLRATAS